MSEIPTDIEAAAQDALARWNDWEWTRLADLKPLPAHSKSIARRKALLDEIARALFAEREAATKAAMERCARFVEVATKAPDQRNSKDRWVESVGLGLATAIRSGLKL